MIFNILMKLFQF